MPFAAKQFGAVLSSHLLEHLPTPYDCARAWDEFHRVADTVFVSLPGKDSIMGWLAPGHKLWVQLIGSGVLKVEDRKHGGSYLIQAGGMR